MNAFTLRLTFGKPMPEQLVVRAHEKGSEVFRTWVNLQSIICQQKNKYQIKFPNKVKAYELFDNEGRCIADKYPDHRRRTVFIELF